MWILECDNEFLDNQRIWLRPGKKYLLGRTKEARRVKGEFFIDKKSISRKHVTLTVSSVRAGNGSLVHTRSEVTIKDENTKFGTEVDGVKVEAGAQRSLKNDEHTFRLGKEETYFRVKWRPVVLTFSFSKKDTKDGKDPLVDIRSQLEQLDIKTIIPYIAGTTTHVVQNKRNTAKGLQALINAKYIVTNSFTDALVEATTPDNLNEDESMSLLEQDFDKNWPNALEFLPAKSREPNERPAEYFAPNPERQTIFEGYSFVFCDQVQFETLLPPITNAGGKAFKFQLQLGRTKADEIVRFVEEHAGEKGLGDLEDESTGRGIVVVRFRGGSDEHQQWALDLGNQVALALGQRLIEQSEFMDAILTNNAKMLRRPLEIEDEQAAGAAAPSVVAASDRAPPATNDARKIEVSHQPSRITSRAPVRRRFKAFDEDDDDDIVLPDPTQTFQDNSINTGMLSAAKSQRASLPRFDSTSQMDIDMQESNTNNVQAQSERKRPAPASDEENEDAFIDSLVPAATAIKRRRLEEEEEAKRTGKEIATTSFLQSQLKVEPPKPKKVKKEIDIKEAVRERRQAEEEAARQDEENLRDVMEGMSVEEMKKLAIVEEMEVPDRPDRPQRRVTNGGANDRWDPAWNGRRNFKKFRRQGENNNARRGRSVMVPLEEAKKKDFGIGEEYWDEPDNRKKKRKDKERATQSQSQTVTSGRSQHTAEVPAELAPDGEEHEIIDVDAPRTSRRMNHAKDADDDIAGFQAVNAKRAAPSRAKAPPPKKQKLLIPESESDSDDDELKFRFRKRR